MPVHGGLGNNKYQFSHAIALNICHSNLAKTVIKYAVKKSNIGPENETITTLIQPNLYLLMLHIDQVRCAGTIGIRQQQIKFSGLNSSSLFSVDGRDCWTGVPKRPQLRLGQQVMLCYNEYECGIRAIALILEYRKKYQFAGIPP